MKAPYFIQIVGPTASGKTSAAIELAKKINGEIISADSRQIYKGLYIGTAQPTHEERTKVKHHLVDFLPLNENFTAQDFVSKATEIATKSINGSGACLL